ncbi:MAG: hypothetical protein PHI56_08865 [Victivallaceae bacterium]|nr:hypothetical protein [Victivallaceae bacterium]MDD3115739.1 hypothetical protein [Victivallaceae bacterium]MDD3704032.1 hypothetical protein [Victivallaceae bacterium]
MKKNFMSAGLLLFIFSGCVNNVGKIVNAENFDMDADARSTLTMHVNNLKVNIGVMPAKNIYGLRTVALFVNRNVRCEPHAMWPDGTPASAHSFITEQEALQIINLSSKYGFLSNADKYFSERAHVTEITHPPPVHAKKWMLPDSKTNIINPPYIWLEYVVFDQHWYSYYRTKIPWDGNARIFMDNIGRILSVKSRQLINKLINTMQNVE